MLMSFRFWEEAALSRLLVGWLLLGLLTEHLRRLMDRRGTVERDVGLLHLGLVVKQLVNKVVLDHHVLF